MPKKDHTHSFCLDADFSAALKGLSESNPLGESGYIRHIVEAHLIKKSQEHYRLQSVFVKPLHGLHHQSDLFGGAENE
jgi:predicted DNA-binding protein